MPATFNYFDKTTITREIGDRQLIPNPSQVESITLEGFELRFLTFLLETYGTSYWKQDKETIDGKLANIILLNWVNYPYPETKPLKDNYMSDEEWNDYITNMKRIIQEII